MVRSGHVWTAKLLILKGWSYLSILSILISREKRKEEECHIGRCTWLGKEVGKKSLVSMALSDQAFRINDLARPYFPLGAFRGMDVWTDVGTDVGTEPGLPGCGVNGAY